MTNEQRIKNLSVPSGRIDVVLDTDTYNEIDDQFALAYMLKSKEKLNTKAIYAAPFYNNNSKLLSNCGAKASPRGGSSCCGAQALESSSFSSYCTWAQ